MTIAKKLLVNLGYGIISGIILVGYVALFNGWSWLFFSIIALFFFLLGSLYGPETNITGNWPAWLITTKDVVGNIILCVIVIICLGLFFLPALLSS